MIKRMLSTKRYLSQIKLNSILIAILFISLSTHSYAGELIIITSNKNTENIVKSDVRRIFLGKSFEFPSGLKAEPLNITSSDPSYALFAKKVLNKTPAQLRAYWAKQVFTGRGTPPETVESKEELIKLVKSKKRYISYIDLKDSNDDLRLVLIID